MSAAEFRALVDDEAQQADARAARRSRPRVKLETSDLPDLSDLTAEEPPLAPTILGLFRGAPLGEAPEAEPRAIVIYRKNLARAVAVARRADHSRFAPRCSTSSATCAAKTTTRLRARGLE